MGIAAFESVMFQDSDALQGVNEGRHGSVVVSSFPHPRGWRFDSGPERKWLERFPGMFLA